MKKNLSLAIILMFAISFGACAITSKAASPKPDALEVKFAELEKEKEAQLAKASDYEFCALGYKNGAYAVVFNSLIKPSSDIDVSWSSTDPGCQPDSEIEISTASLVEGELYSYLIVINPLKIKCKQFQLLIQCELSGKVANQLFLVHNGKEKDIEKSEEQ